MHKNLMGVGAGKVIRYSDFFFFVPTASPVDMISTFLMAVQYFPKNSKFLVKPLCLSYDKGSSLQVKIMPS